MPGSIHISAIQPPVTTPLFLQVAVGKREYSGNVERDGFSFPVTSLRDSMVMMLYNADRDLISKAEVKTKAIVESGTTDVVFTLDSGGKIILQLQFLLSDEDRKRIQEMRNSAMKRKQQELLGNGNEPYFQDGALSKQHAEKFPNTPSKGDQPTLRKSMSLDDLQEMAIFSGVSVDPHAKASKDLLVQSGGNTSRLKNPIDSKKGHVKPESSSSNAVKKMISAFESSSSQGLTSIMRIRSESSLKGISVSSETSSTSGASVNDSGRTQAGLVAGTSGKVTFPSGDIGFSSRSGRHAMLGNNKSNASGQTGLSGAYERRRRSSSRRDGATKQNMEQLSRSKNQSQAKHRRSIGPYSFEQTRSMDFSRYYLHQPSNHLVATSSIWIHPHVCITTASRQLKDLLELEQSTYMGQVDDSERLDVRDDTRERTSDGDTSRPTDGFPMLNGWLINQGVRVVIVIIACGAVFLNNR